VRNKHDLLLIYRLRLWLYIHGDYLSNTLNILLRSGLLILYRLGYTSFREICNPILVGYRVSTHVLEVVDSATNICEVPSPFHINSSVKTSFHLLVKIQVVMFNMWLFVNKHIREEGHTVVRGKLSILWTPALISGIKLSTYKRVYSPLRSGLGYRLVSLRWPRWLAEMCGIYIATRLKSCPIE